MGRPRTRYPDLAHLPPDEYRKQASRRYTQEYYGANKEECRAKSKERSKTRRSRGVPEVTRTPEKMRLRRYGLSPEAYDAMFEQQHGLYAICQTAPAIHVDHCHATGKVRGLLCFKCNIGLGAFNDTPGHLQAAIAYLACANVCTTIASGSQGA